VNIIYDLTIDYYMKDGTSSICLLSVSKSTALWWC